MTSPANRPPSEHRVNSIRFWAAAAAALTLCAIARAVGAPATIEPTASQIIDQFQKNAGVFTGYRRNHAKGICVSGYFQSSAGAARDSVAQVFAPGERTPVIGRFSVPGTNPYAWDGGTPIRGMALQFTQADGQQWRTAMNAVPAFPVSTPQADYAFMEAQQPVAATGDPDPAKLAAFFASHPNANAFRIWDQTTPPSASYATPRYNSLDAFELVDAHGRHHAVRWSMLPENNKSTGAIRGNGPDYLSADLHRRLAHGPLRWQLSITLANPGDPVDNAARRWTGAHRRIDAGTLVIDAAQAQKNGPCRDTNFDPLVLPTGIEPSADPLLAFRSAVYTQSHRRRSAEHTHRRAAAHSPAAGARR